MDASGFPTPYTLALASNRAVGWPHLHPGSKLVAGINSKLVAAAAKRGLCGYGESAYEAANATIVWLVADGLEVADACEIEVEAAIDRLGKPDQPPARPANKVIWAISLIPKHDGNRSAIAEEIGVPRTTTTEGKEWEPFNLRLEQYNKSGRMSG